MMRGYETDRSPVQIRKSVAAEAGERDADEHLVGAEAGVGSRLDRELSPDARRRREKAHHHPREVGVLVRALSSPRGVTCGQRTRRATRGRARLISIPSTQSAGAKASNEKS